MINTKTSERLELIRVCSELRHIAMQYEMLTQEAGKMASQVDPSKRDLRKMADFRTLHFKELHDMLKDEAFKLEVQLLGMPR